MFVHPITHKKKVIVMTLPDLVLSESILISRAPRCCPLFFLCILHLVLWALAVFLAIGALCWAAGYAVLGLAVFAAAAGDTEILFGFSGNDVVSLSQYGDELKQGGMLLSIGFLMSCAAQGILISCASQVQSQLRDRETRYVPDRCYRP